MLELELEYTMDMDMDMDVGLKIFSSVGVASELRSLSIPASV